MLVALIEVGVAALVLASCGEKPEPAVGTPTPSPAPALREPDQGDESGVRVDLRIRVTRRVVRVDPRTAAAFLPLRFEVKNATRRRVRVHISGQPALRIGPGSSATADSRGEKPGHVRISALGHSATVRVKSGG